jgi:hypothetical protein
VRNIFNLACAFNVRAVRKEKNPAHWRVNSEILKTVPGQFHVKLHPIQGPQNHTKPVWDTQAGCGGRTMKLKIVISKQNKANILHQKKTL